MDDKDYMGYYGKKRNCLDCAKFFYGCQQIDGERDHPDKAKHWARCEQWYWFRREERKMAELSKVFDNWDKHTPRACRSGAESQLVGRKEVMCMSELDNAKARGLIFEYLQLKAKMDHIEAEGAVVKAQLEALMKTMGVTALEGTEGKASIVTKHTYQFDVPAILKVVPDIAGKLKLSNEDFNKVLVGNEVALAPYRKVLGTTNSLTISALKKAK